MVIWCLVPSVLLVCGKVIDAFIMLFFLLFGDRDLLCCLYFLFFLCLPPPPSSPPPHLPFPPVSPTCAPTPPLLPSRSAPLVHPPAHNRSPPHPPHPHPLTFPPLPHYLEEKQNRDRFSTGLGRSGWRWKVAVRQWLVWVWVVSGGLRELIRPATILLWEK